MKKPQVKLYSTKTCPFCMMEKAWLESENIDHKVVYVDEDYEEARSMIQKTGQMGVPVTQLTYADGKEEFVIGFDKGRLSQILK